MLFISDIDGTLVDNNGNLTHYTINTLNSLLDDGVRFTVASARSVFSIQQMLKGLKLKLPVISFNGAFISCFETGKHEVIHSIPAGISERVYNLIREFNLRPFISTFDGQKDCLYHDELVNEGMRWYKKDRIEREDDRLCAGFEIENIMNQDVICINTIACKEDLEPLKSEINNRFRGEVELHFFENQYSPGWYWLTVHDKNASKDNACKILLNKLGLDSSDLIVFGDNINDLSLFKAGGTKIAVENAVEELKAEVDQIIGCNEEDAVALYIKTRKLPLDRLSIPP